MFEWIAGLWTAINANSGGISAVAAAVVPLAAGVVWLLRKRRPEEPPVPATRGGKGGNASVGGNGVAIGEGVDAVA